MCAYNISNAYRLSSIARIVLKVSISVLLTFRLFLFCVLLGRQMGSRCFIYTLFWIRSYLDLALRHDHMLGALFGLAGILAINCMLQVALRVLESLTSQRYDTL